MQDGAVWKLAAAEARLDFAGLLATVDLSRPEFGLTGIHFQGRPLNSTALLGVALQSLPSSGTPAEVDAYIKRLLGGQIAPPIADAYVRQRDLVVTYSQTPEVPFRVQIYWRAATGPAGNPAIDLQVSVQTSLLDSRPAVTTATSLSDVELLHLAECAEGQFEVVKVETDRPARSDDQPQGHCYDLFRPAGGEASYGEMIHPADEGNRSQLVTRDGPQRTPTDVSLCHHLFASFLEKGVILRARLRGVFLPRDRDTELAAEAYRQFLADPPPLTT